MPIFSKLESQLNLAQIEEVERYVGLTFPKEYKDHLLQYNGGQCTPNVFKFSENGNWTDSCIGWFLAIYDGEYDNLKKYIQIYKFEEKRLPSHIVPIANDPGGNLICISCNSDDEGCVYFWDHENEVNYNVSNDGDYSNLFFVSNNFVEFINSLYEDFA